MADRRQEEVDELPVSPAQQPESEVPKATSHAAWLRAILRAERIKRGWTLEQTAAVVARESGRERLTKQALQQWEEGAAQPRVDVFDAWARALGFQLEIELSVKGDGAVSVRIPSELADACRAMAMLLPADRQVVVDLIDRLQRHS